MFEWELSVIDLFISRFDRSVTGGGFLLLL